MEKVMDEKEIAKISTASDTISWAALVESSLDGDVSKMHFSGSKGHTLDEIWVALRREVHDLLCTHSAKYAKERSSFAVTLKPAIAALAAFLAKDYGFPVAAASSLAGLALLLPIQMVKEAWCSSVAAGDIKEGERKQLRKLVKEHESGTSKS
jgi:hypothetical protein